MKGGRNYNPAAYEDALNRTTIKLKAAFAGQDSTTIGAGQSSDIH